MGEIRTWLAPVLPQMSERQVRQFAEMVRSVDEHADWAPILAEVLAEPR